MSGGDFEKFEAGGGQVPECVQLHRDMEGLYRSLAHGLRQELEDDPRAEELIDTDQIEYELRGERLGLQGEVAAAAALEPDTFCRAPGFYALSAFLYRDEGGFEKVNITRHFDSPNTYMPGGSSLGFIVAPDEDRPLLLNALDPPAVTYNNAVQRGETPPLSSDEGLPDIAAYREALASHRIEPRYLNEGECASIRQILPQIQPDIEVTIRENNL